MQLMFLGTAAANAYPEAFCRCANCEQARALGGTSLRKRSAALVNDDPLLDLGPDIHEVGAVEDFGRIATGVLGSELTARALADPLARILGVLELA